MSLGKLERLLDDRQSINGTYHPILTVRILGPFQRVTATQGNNGEGVHDVIMDAGSDSVGVRDIVTNGRNGCICVYRERPLGAGS